MSNSSRHDYNNRICYIAGYAMIQSFLRLAFAHVSTALAHTFYISHLKKKKAGHMDFSFWFQLCKNV